MPLIGGPPDIKKLKTKHNVKGLIKAMDYRKDPQIRRAAAQALGQIRDPQALVPLVDALKDENVAVRQAAAWALGQIGDARVVKLLAPILQDEDVTARAIAARALGQIGDAQAEEPLVAVAGFNVEVWSVRQAAAWALDKIGWQPDSSEVGAVYWIVKRQWDKCVEIGGPAVEPLTAAFKDKDVAVRHAAIETLGKIGRAGLRPLVAAIEDPDEGVRWRAAEALSRLYRQGILNEKQKRMVLAQKGAIIKEHVDYYDQETETPRHVDEAAMALKL